MPREQLGRLFYRLAYAHGKPRWDTGRVPEALDAAVRDLDPGRFLDLGCGTGGAVVHLATRGWDALGVDFVASAIAAARRRAADAGVAAGFRVGDVTRLGELIGDRQFDLILDAGCYQGLSEAGRERYADGVARVAAPGATFLLYGFSAVPATWRLIGAPGVGSADAETRFAPWFALEQRGVAGMGRRDATWYRLRRRA